MSGAQRAARAPAGTPFSFGACPIAVRTGHRQRLGARPIPCARGGAAAPPAPCSVASIPVISGDNGPWPARVSPTLTLASLERIRSEGVNGGRGTRRANVILCKHFVRHHLSHTSQARRTARAVTRLSPQSRALRRRRVRISGRSARARQSQTRPPEASPSSIVRRSKGSASSWTSAYGVAMPC
jgi:hypothetical protein